MRIWLLLLQLLCQLECTTSYCKSTYRIATGLTPPTSCRTWKRPAFFPTRSVTQLCCYGNSDVCVCVCVQGTLVGILDCCCNEGNIEGATSILDQMRSLDMEINENIYASLITGMSVITVD